MKKICFVTTVSTTLEAFVLELAKELHRTGDFDITFICSPNKTFEDKLPQYIHFIPVKMGRGISFDGFAAFTKLKHIFKKNKFDLVQYSTPNASCYASLAAKKAKIPVRLYCQWGIVYVGFRSIKRLIFKFIEKNICYNSTWIEPDSFSNLDFAHYEKLYPIDKGSVIGHGSACGIDFIKFDISKKEEFRKKVRTILNIPHDAFAFGFVGRVTRDKGFNELLSAFKTLNNCYLIIVGGMTPDSSIDKELFEWSKNSPHVIYVGHTQRVEEYLSAMDCFVLPSYREGFGMGIIEAEAMGVPVIVSKIPGPIDAIIDGKTGIFVKKGDINGLITAMKELSENKTKLNTFGVEGHKFVLDYFDQKKLFKRIIEDRKKLLGMEEC